MSSQPRWSKLVHSLKLTGNVYINMGQKSNTILVISLPTILFNIPHKETLGRLSLSNSVVHRFFHMFLLFRQCLHILLPEPSQLLLPFKLRPPVCVPNLTHAD